MAGPDWGQGLPAGILSRVSQLGGCELTKAMRGVNHTWKEEFEFSVTGIEITDENPQPSSFVSFSDRFPSLTNLDLGKCLIEESSLVFLGRLQHLGSLHLGTASYYTYLYFPGLAGSLTGPGLEHVRGLPLASLDLGYCRSLTNAGLRFLEGVRLTSLRLEGCIQLTDASLECLRGLPLTSLSLRNCGDSGYRAGGGLTDAGLIFLGEMPLARLDLHVYSHLTSAGLGHLRALPVTDLDLGFCRDLTPSSLALLKDMPLRRLVLGGCVKALTRQGLESLKGLPLERLDLSSSKITDAGLAHLQGLPLVSLNLSGCHHLTLDGLQHLLIMPLARLNVYMREWRRGDPIRSARVLSLVGAQAVLPEVLVTDEFRFVV